MGNTAAGGATGLAGGLLAGAKAAKSAASTVVSGVLNAMQQGGGAGNAVSAAAAAGGQNGGQNGGGQGQTPQNPIGGPGERTGPRPVASRGAASSTGGFVQQAYSLGQAAGNAYAQAAIQAASAGASVGGGASQGAGIKTGTWKLANEIASKFGLTITSSYRTPAHNRAVGGVEGSDHTHGSAANPGAFDFTPPSEAAAAFARSLGAKQVLIHDAGSGMHLHVGFFNRGGIVGGKGGRDRNMALLSKGEGVLTASGMSMIDQIAGPGTVGHVMANQRPHSAGKGAAPAPRRAGGATVVLNINGDINVGSQGDYDAFVGRLTKDLKMAMLNTPTDMTV